MNWPSRRQWMIAAALACAAGGAALYVTRPAVQQQSDTTSGGSDPLQPGEVATVLEPDAIEAVESPSFVTAGKADTPDGTPVIGVAMSGEAHAFPIAVLSRVEIVNDRLGGGNIAVTW